ncbi:hypothetical protein ACWD4N_45480, partial [Streptomyces sp. NPDC002586]
VRVVDALGRRDRDAAEAVYELLEAREVDLLDKARLLLNDGRSFGPGGEGFVRLNFGTSPALLQEILGRMRDAVG